VEYLANTKGVGRECSGYIYYILKNYYKLPTWIEFVHGAPEKSASLAKRYLMEPRGRSCSRLGWNRKASVKRIGLRESKRELD
jgi:hypothetical protein